MPNQGEQQSVTNAKILALLESGYSVLTPNFRLSRTISAAWDAQQLGKGRGAWPAAAVSPLESWLQGQWQKAVRSGAAEPLVPVSSGQQLELWQEIIATFEHNTQGFNLIRPTAAAAQAGKARDTLLRWQVKLDQSRYQQLFELDEDCATFLQWQAMFVARLAELEMTTPSDCLVTLLQCAVSLPQSKLALVGFDDIPPLLRSCVVALADDLQEIDSTSSVGERTACSFPDKRTELAAVARWAKLQTLADANCRIGIVLPTMNDDRPALEYLLRREFDCLDTHYTSLPVNFSTGIALDRVPIVRDALLALGMGGRRIAVNDVLKLMRSRFLGMDDVDSPLAMRFIERLFDAGTAFIQASDLRYRASRPMPSLAATEIDDGESAQGLILGRILLEISGLRELRSSALPSTWADRFSTLLALWGWPGRSPLDSIEYQQLQLWYNLLDEFSGYDAIHKPQSFDEALNLLTRCCARQVSQPQTPDSNIQVLGLLEAAGLPFDKLWLCDMQASIWPAAARPNPFIPIHLQRDMKMPHASADREWHFASQLMTGYVNNAGEIFASYAQQKEGVPEKPSALLEEFNWQSTPQGEPVNSQWLDLQKSAQMEQFDDNMAPPVGATELSRLRGGSGLLEDQSHCPFRAFARRRLGVNPLGEPDVALSAAERGSLLHDALYHLWGALGDSSTLASMPDVDLEAAVTQAVSHAIGAMPAHRRGVLSHAYFELEGQRLRNLLNEWLAVERQRSEFKVMAREQSITLRLEQLEISLRVDRIDQLPDGAQFIIDYKSGLGSAQDWLGERPSKPQLTLYGIAVNETVAGLAFAQVHTRNCKFVGAGQTEVAPGVQTDIEKLVKDKMPAKDWEDLTALWRCNLERLAREFVAGAAQVDPLATSSCNYCGLQALCRVGEA